MINGLPILSYKKQGNGLELTGNGLYLTKSKGSGCNQTCDKKIKKQKGNGLKILK